MNAMELVLFSAKDGVDDTTMRAAAAAIMPDIERLEGFVSRHFGQENDGTYADIIIWASRDKAEQAAKDVMAIPSCQRFFALIAPSSIVMKHYA